MDNEDNCALNPDGSLKNASQIKFFNSPSDRDPLPTVQDDPGHESPSETAKARKEEGLKGKEPARLVAGQRRRMATAKAQAQTSNFFKVNFVVGSSAKAATSSDDDQGIEKGSDNKRKRAASSTAATSSVPKKRARVIESEEEDEDVDTPNDGSNPGHSKEGGMDRDDSDDSDGEGEGEEGDEDGEEEEEGNGAGAVEEEEDPLEAYERNKEALHKARRAPRKHAHQGQDPRTQDLRAMFTKDEREVNGKLMKGHNCNVCRNDLNRHHTVYFMTGGNSSLRKHISRNFDTHGEQYLKKCKKLEVDPNPLCLPATKEQVAADSGPAQSSLGDYVKSTPKWTKEGLLEHIVEFVVRDDQSFSVVNKNSFRMLLKYQRPATKEEDIPKRQKLRDEVVEKAKVAIARLREYYKTIPSLISITFDAWTSKAYDPYLAVTAHYITAPPEAPLDWSLESNVIGFEPIKGNHGGANMAATTLTVIDDLEIRDKLGWGTADNATNNDKAMRCLERVFRKGNSTSKKWVARHRRVRCMEHTVYLSAKAFIEEINPKKPKSIRSTKNGTASVEDSDDEEEDDDDEEDDDELDWTADWTYLDSLDENEEVDTVIEFLPGDVLGKVLALVNQIRLSPQAKAYFGIVCTEEELTPLELIKWIRTRWGSMFDLLERFILNKAAVNKFVLVADHSRQVPKLKNKKYYDYALTEEEWTLLELMKEVLEFPRRVQSEFSSQTQPTLWKTLPILEFFQSAWENLLLLDKFAPVHAAIEKGLEKLRKWYQKIDESDSYFICLVLIPDIKLEYFKSNWDTEYYDKGYAALEKAFDLYYERPALKPAKSSSSDGSQSQGLNGGIASDWIRNSIQARLSAQKTQIDPRKELNDYLSSDLEDIEDPVRWWGHHSKQYPTLARMARDYLAIQGSSVASERAFSSSGQTDTINRNRIKPKMFGQTQILKSLYNCGFLKAHSEADAYDPLEWADPSEWKDD